MSLPGRRLDLGRRLWGLGGGGCGSWVVGQEVADNAVSTTRHGSSSCGSYVVLLIVILICLGSYQFARCLMRVQSAPLSNTTPLPDEKCGANHKTTRTLVFRNKQ
jgi:hypothetical protein